MMALARLLALGGLSLLVLAGMVWAVARLGLGRVPGTVVIRRGGFTLWAPVGLWILASLALTLVLNLIGRWAGR